MAGHGYIFASCEDDTEDLYAQEFASEALKPSSSSTAFSYSSSSGESLRNVDIRGDERKRKHSVAQMDAEGSHRVETKLSKHTDAINGFTTLVGSEDGRVGPYDPSKEESRPSLAIYHPNFSKVEEAVNELCADFIDRLGMLVERGYVNLEVSHVCKELIDIKCVQQQYPAIGPVAVLGPAGHGKSSFMNSVLHQVRTAPVSDNSNRGTNIVHEYLAEAPGQKSKFLVSALYYDIDQIKKLVERHCENVFKFMYDADEAEDDDKADMQSKHDAGIEFFHILLCNRPEFRSEQATVEWFHEQGGFSNGTQPYFIGGLVQRLVIWIEHLKASRNLVHNVEHHEADAEKELYQIFRLVSKQPRSHARASTTPHPWPIIDKVRIHQNTDLLNAGVVLADTPGVAESNQSVLERTTDYLKRAGTILVVEQFKRINGSQTLEENLRRCIRLRKMGSTYLIVTMVDDCQEFDFEDRFDLSPEDQAQLDAAENAVAQLEDERRFLQQTGQSTADSNLREHYRRLADLSARIAMVQARVKQVTIEIRNREVIDALRGKFRQLDYSPHAPDLPVFFVSNTEYQKHLAGYDAKTPPSLDVKATGIPAVRQMLYAVPARGKATMLQRICNTRLIKFYSGFHGILTKTKLERKTEVEVLLRKLLKERSSVLDLTGRDLDERFQDCIVTVAVSNEGKWIRGSQLLLNQWAECAPSTLGAFCRKSGRWQLTQGKGTNKRVKPTNWNELLQAICVDKMASAFNKFEDELKRIEIGNMKAVKEFFDNLVEKLESCAVFHGIEGAPEFFTYLVGVREMFKVESEVNFQRFRGSFAEVRNWYLLPDALGQPSYVCAALEETYEECASIKTGTWLAALRKHNLQKLQKGGVHETRVQVLREAFRGTGKTPSLFRRVSDAASKDFQFALQTWKEKSAARLDESCADILRDFERRFHIAKFDQKSGDAHAVEMLKATVIRALEKLRGPISADLKKCLDWEEAADH